eukprot:CAMPEP_0115024360 /NCGR_PEP_ID=MMETSP0216-20121206/33153_1 /TAXON_ID=223996 /ORGANISM="Protocruzia adherens, Strain Boccale" /LENGTH=41 /DNA_ID= /DNA_START= /DNA_END= /DNA_ORIENTATION=
MAAVVNFSPKRIDPENNRSALFELQEQQHGVKLSLGVEKPG